MVENREISTFSQDEQAAGLTGERKMKNVQIEFDKVRKK
jgi:hypothetical protein